MAKRTDTREISREQVIADLTDALRASQNASDVFDETAAELLGVNRTDMRCMDIIERHVRITAGELADAAGVTTGAVTAVLDRMEAAGYARRIRDTADRRRVLVELTPLAHRVGELIWGPLAEAFQRMVKRYSTEQLELFLDFMLSGETLNAGQLERIRTLAPRMQRARRRVKPD
jgi:DNA-binding MarR family transcriptional regulator